MDKQIKKLISEIKELKIYYDKAKESGDVDIQERFKEEIEIKKEELELLKEQRDKVQQLANQKKKYLNTNVEMSVEEIEEQRQKVKFLEKKMLEEEKRKQKERKKIEKEKQRQKKLEMQQKRLEKKKAQEEDELRKKADLKELKYGTFILFISIIILIFLMIGRAVPVLLNQTVAVENMQYYNFARFYTIVVFILFLLFTYIQTDIKKIKNIRIYGIITFIAVFISFGGLILTGRPKKILNGTTYLILPGILLIVLAFIIFKNLVRNKLAYEYKRVVEEDDYLDEGYDDEEIEYVYEDE